LVKLYITVQVYTVSRNCGNIWVSIVATIIVAAVLQRMYQPRRPLPQARRELHFLILKMLIITVKTTHMFQSFHSCIISASRRTNISANIHTQTKILSSLGSECCSFPCDSLETSFDTCNRTSTATRFTLEKEESGVFL